MKISACMIIKNESEMLPQCLKSIRWVDEIVCVDTGSTDDSVEIAKRHGAKVYACAWKDNFSLHRNQSVANATGDWFIVIDADEELVSEGDPNNIREYLGNVPDFISALLAETTEVVNGARTASWFNYKLFRASDFIGYRGIVHNEPFFKNQSSITEIRLNHFGYSLSAEKMKIKTERTKSLLSQRIYDNPEDHIAHLYMIQTLFYTGDLGGAEEHGLLYFHLAKTKKDDRYNEIAYFFMCLIYSATENFQEAYCCGKKGLVYYPDSIDLNYIMAKICFQTVQKKQFGKYANKYFLELIKDRNLKTPKTVCFSANDVAEAEIVELLR